MDTFAPVHFVFIIGPLDHPDVLLVDNLQTAGTLGSHS